MSPVQRLYLNCALPAISVLAMSISVAANPIESSFGERGYEPLSIDDAYSMRSLGTGAFPADLSPDGQLLALSVLGEGTRSQTDDAPVTNACKSSTGEKSVTAFTETGVSEFASMASSIWITRTTSGETTKLSQPHGSLWCPAWSPDGKWLAFCSDRDGAARLWLWERATGNVRRVSDVIVRYYWPTNPPRWSPDGRQLLVPALHPGTPLAGYEQAAGLKQGQPSDHESAALGSTAKVYESAGSDARLTPVAALKPGVAGRADVTSNFYVDLAMIDVVSGRAKRLVEGIELYNYSFSPRGDQIAYAVGEDPVASAGRSHFNLVVLSSSNGRSQVVASGVSPARGFAPFSWAPNGEQLAFADDKGEVFLASASGRDQKKVKREQAPVPLAGYFARPPLFGRSGRFVYFVPRDSDTILRASTDGTSLMRFATIPDRTVVDLIPLGDTGTLWSPDGGRSLVAVVRDDATQKMGFYAVEFANGRPFRLLEEDKLFQDTHYSIDVSDDGNRVAFASEEAQHPQDYWISDGGFTNPRQVSHVNPQLERYTFGQSRLIEWQSLDGRALRAALLLPPDYVEGKRYPMVVEVYGGWRLSRNANKFGGDQGTWAPGNMQILATRGYVVMETDSVMESGNRMYDLAQSVLPGVNEAIELGIADPERLAVMGQSNGGYSTMALITQTRRFKAAVVRSGFADIIGTATYLSKADRDNLRMFESGAIGFGGTLWDVRERYIESSPLFYLDRVETPVLLLHGTADEAVPVIQAEQIFTSLRRLDKTVTLVEYEGEGHGATNARENLIDGWDRILRWLDAYLGHP